MDRKFKLTLTENQLRVINAALEEYFRAALNQWDLLANRLAFRGFNDHPNTNIEFDQRMTKKNAAIHILNAVGEILVDRYDNPIPEEDMIAADMWRILRWELQPESFKREIYRDTYHESDEPPIKVEEVSE